MLCSIGRAHQKEPDMANLVNINVSVPEEHVAHVYAYVADLLNGGNGDGASEVPPPKNAKRAARGFGRDSVRRNYLGGQSNYWRPFLEALADQPDEWVGWHRLCDM